MAEMEHFHVLALNPKDNTLLKGTHNGLYKSRIKHVKILSIKRPFINDL